MSGEDVTQAYAGASALRRELRKFRTYGESVGGVGSMKIRHKQSGVVLEGAFCECATGSDNFPTRYYFMAHGDNSQYDMREWEAVQPEPKETFRRRYEGRTYDSIMESLHARIECLERKEPA